MNESFLLNKLQINILFDYKTSEDVCIYCLFKIIAFKIVVLFLSCEDG